MLPTHLEKFSTPIPVLHGQGFVRLVDLLGDDGSIVTAALPRGTSIRERDGFLAKLGLGL